MNDKIEEAKALSDSKRKFAFKSKNKTPKAGSEAIAGKFSKVPDDHVTNSRPSDHEPSSPANRRSLGTINITGCRGEQVALPPLSTEEDVTQAAASIYDVQNCTIDLRARSSIGSPLAKLQISNAQQTLIICGAVGGSVFLSESQDCVLLATSGQMRFYKCDNCAIYLHCTSKPVIELSDRIKFAPLPSILVSLLSFRVLDLCSKTSPTHKQFQDIFNQSGNVYLPATRLTIAQGDGSPQHQKSNSWDQVEDFNWLHNDASPHWKVIPKDDRICDELWQAAFHGEHERQTLQSILSASL